MTIACPNWKRSLQKSALHLSSLPRIEAYNDCGVNRSSSVKRTTDVQLAIEALRYRPLYAKQWADFGLKLAVMVVNSGDDATQGWQRVTMAIPRGDRIRGQPFQARLCSGATCFSLNRKGSNETRRCGILGQSCTRCGDDVTQNWQAQHLSCHSFIY